MYNWCTLLYAQNWYNIVNQLYANILFMPIFFKKEELTQRTQNSLVILSFTFSTKTQTKMYGCESWTIKKLSAEKLMLLNCGVGENSWESFGLQGDQTSQS